MAFRFSGLGAPSVSYSPTTVPGGAVAGASAGSLSSTLSGTVSYAVLSGAIQVNALTGAVTTTAAAPVSGSIPGVVTASNGTAVVATPVSVPVVPTLGPIGTAGGVSGTVYLPTTYVAGATMATLTGKTPGSTLTISPNDGRVVFNATQTALLVGMTATAAGASTIYMIIETLPGSTNSGRQSTITVNGVGPVTAIAPTATTTCTFQEVVTFDLSHCFTDTAGTVACTQVGQQVACVRDRASNIAWTQTTAAARPILRIDSQSGNYGLEFDGVVTYMLRANQADVLSAVAVFALDHTGKYARSATTNYQTIISKPGPTSGGNVTGYFLWNNRQNSILGADVFGFQRHRSTGADNMVQHQSVVGHTECLVMSSDGTNYNVYRSGVKSTTLAMAGTVAGLDTGNSAVVGCTYRSDGTTGDFYKGLLLGIACSSGTLGASEIPGVSQWAVNLAAQQQTLTGWLGAFFSGNATAGESAAAHAVVMKRFNPLLTKSEYVPSSFPDLRTAITGSSTILMADFGLATDGSSYYLTFDGAIGGTQYIYKFDGFIFTLLSTLSVGGAGAANPSVTQGAGGYGVGLTFARNFDNTIYTDAFGRAYLFCDAGTTPGNQMTYIRSLDNTWSTGGGWGAPSVVPGFLVGGVATTNQIDPTVMRDGAGVWHMAFSDYVPPGQTAQLNGNLRHAYCTTATPDGLWVLDDNADYNSASTFAQQGNGCEGPQYVNLGTIASPNPALLVDRTGCGYSLITLPNGLGGAPGVKTYVQCDDVIEHGEVAPWIPGFSQPTLQTSAAPRPNKWPGKGLLTNGDISSAANATTYAAAYGSWATTFNKASSLTAPTFMAYVADPNGDMTATRVAFPAAPASTYNWVANQTHEYLGTTAGFASQHTFGIWMRGTAGGEQIYLQSSRNNSDQYVTYTPLVLTTTWTYYEITVYAPFNNFGVIYFGTGSQAAGLPAQTIDVCWPCFK